MQQSLVRDFELLLLLLIQLLVLAVLTPHLVNAKRETPPASFVELMFRSTAVRLLPV